mmetsp:Transcript_49245/g.130424  ORF Transcript_49245/g.130424 Transcript_49245/m.130424 type:complete len:424 (-) Transcript_49245:51-1322(-)
MRNNVAFFLLGLLNNLPGVINNAGASNILPGAIAVVYIINTSPQLLLKLTAPFWWERLSYRTKITIAGLCFAANLVLVSGGLHLPLGVTLLGVALSDIGSGLGECSVLALSQFYDNPKNKLNAWSSGTGAAGVVGYLLSMFVLPNIPTWGKLVLGAVFVLSYWAAFFILLEAPWVDALRGSSIAGSVLNSVVDSHANIVDHNGSRNNQLESNFLSDAAPELDGAAHPPQRVVVDIASTFTMRDRLLLQARLMKYVVPLVVVYWAEYAIQSGAWTAFALPGNEVLVKDSRAKAYHFFNLFYQIGVLVSRSCGNMCAMSLRLVWALAWLQVAFLIFFVFDGAFQFWAGYTLLVPSFAVGLLGGTNYVQTCLSINRCLPPHERELALSTVSVGGPVGVFLADVSGLFIQWCLNKALGIDVSGSCPF